MPLWLYVKEGVAFSPEEMTAMGDAFTGAIADLGIGSEDQTKREAVAQFILDYVRADAPYPSASIKHVDAAKIRAVTVRTLSEFAKRGGPSD